MNLKSIKSQKKGEIMAVQTTEKKKSTQEKPPMERLVKEIENMGRTHGLNNVFVTFLELSATSLGAHLDPVNAARREEEYEALESKLSQEELQAYAGMLALLAMAVREYRDDPADILGDIFHRLNLSNKWNGQFFTPIHICELMAEITGIADSVKELEKGHIKVNEPACGSGAMVIGAIGSMVKRGIDYHDKIFFVAQDLDIRCVWMAYIQFCLYGIPAVVLQGNSLTDEVNSCWYTAQGIHVLMKEENERIEAENERKEKRRLKAMKANKKTIKEMKELVARLQQADKAYYKYDEPVMTDRDYDELVDKLKKLETETGIILSGSPTQKVSGDILEELATVEHSKPMLSADKTKSVSDLAKFADGRETVLSWKMDGLTIVLRYEEGEFKQAITRGRDGTVGEDVTHTVKHFKNVPLVLPVDDSIEVRGEGVVSWKDFNEMNSGLEEPYSHPRNLAAGSTRTLDANKAAERNLEFAAFELVTDMEIQTKMEQLDYLENLGFYVVPHKFLKAVDEKSLQAEIDKMKPEEYDYPVDGLILEFNDVEYGKSLGATGHHENRLMALKWEDELYETKFVGIEPAVTRNGMISLTGIFEPVTIGGTEVSRAYLHNIDIFRKLALGKGDTIEVYKANMIIPQIASNKSRTGTVRLPNKCPCCDSRLDVVTSEGGTRQLYCVNPDCAAKLVGKFVHFCDKTRMNIEGLSEKTLSVFIRKGWIRNFSDLYRLETYHEDIVNTEGFGEKSFAKIQASIDKSRKCHLNQFIAGMGIPMVGRHAAKTISDYFGGDFDDFMSALENGFDFVSLEDFGLIMQSNLYDWFENVDYEELEELLSELEFVKEEKTMSENTVFTGKTIVATGKLENYTRDEIQAKIISIGAKPGSSVSKKTDYLIVGEKAGSKLAKAKELGVTTLTEQEFERMLA